MPPELLATYMLAQRDLVAEQLDRERDTDPDDDDPE